MLQNWLFRTCVASNPEDDKNMIKSTRKSLHVSPMTYNLEEGVEFIIVGFHGSLVRKGFDLKSEQIDMLDRGTLCRVIDSRGRRARIFSPCDGWISLSSSEGYVIAQRVQNWVPDGYREWCGNCAALFTLTLRKHHCRSCGDIYCRNCVRCPTSAHQLSGGASSTNMVDKSMFCIKCSKKFTQIELVNLAREFNDPFNFADEEKEKDKRGVDVPTRKDSSSTEGTSELVPGKNRKRLPEKSRQAEDDDLTEIDIRTGPVIFRDKNSNSMFWKTLYHKQCLKIKE